MNLVKCNNGHFYDGDKYPSCPFCSPGDSAFVNQGMPNMAPQFGGAGSEDTPTMPGQGFGGFGGGKEDTPTVPGQSFGSFGGGFGGDFNGGINQGFETKPTVPGDMPNINPLVNNEEEDTSTIRANFTPDMKINPVVGWLVVTSGEEKGESKKLVTNYNFIGRDASMDVVLKSDKSISRIKHAIVVFEPNSGKFYAQPGESHELFYVNGQVVLNSVELAPYDSLKLGNTELIFVPFCGPQFSWKDVE